MRADNEYTFRIAENPEVMSIVVAGSLTEESVLETPDPRGRRVVIDAQGVQRINSMGVRTWLQFMERIAAAASEVVVERLPPVLVQQASMISNFLGGARVASFLTPWFCSSCEHTLEQLHAFSDAIPQAIACPQCTHPMELDWDPEHYLAFRQL